jgi:tRNA-Thr(GGU) m(6)t(6)A37 methyltransferase TsaA
MDVTYHAIGSVRSPFVQAAGMPIQSSRAQGAQGSLELEPEYWAGLEDLAGFSHLLLVSHLHRAGPAVLQVVPFLDTRQRGIFATRAPARPNPIAISVLRILRVEPGRVLVAELDLLDGTPILDIKPYVPEFDARGDARSGWYAEAARRNEDVVADDRFSGDPG